MGIIGVVLLILSQAAWAGPAPGQEAVLCWTYSLRLPQDARDRKVELRVHVTQGSHKRTVSVDLFEANTEVCAQLGRWSADSSYTVDAPLSLEGEARLQLGAPAFRAAPDFSDQGLAYAHSPYIALRDDQLDDNRTDRPLVMAYDVRREAGRVVLRYTAVFSDEDSMTATSDFQMARYGRRTDIEWVYWVELDPVSGAVFRRVYQGGFSLTSSAPDVGHSYQEFRGEFLPGSKHPVLYNSARNNIFADRPSDRQRLEGALRGHHLDPQIRVDSPRARETVMLQRPWTYLVSDQELAREGRLVSSIEDYLLVSIGGKLDVGAFVARLRLADGGVVESGGGQGNLDRLGEDMWGQESLTGLPVGRGRLDRLTAGAVGAVLGFADAGLLFGGVAIKVQELKFYRLKRDGAGMVLEELMRQRCALAGFNTVCTF